MKPKYLVPTCAKAEIDRVRDANAADRQIREMLAPVLHLEADGAPAASMVEQLHAAHREALAILDRGWSGPGDEGRTMDEHAHEAAVRFAACRDEGQDLLALAWRARFDYAALYVQGARAVHALGKAMGVEPGDYTGLEDMAERAAAALGEAGRGMAEELVDAWAEEHASDVDRARAQGRAEARDRLITRLHDSEPLRLGAAAVVAPGSRALREAARSSDAAGPLALDLLDVREEGAPPPRQPVHPALVDIDGAPVCLEMMGHRCYEGVLTALGGPSYRLDPLTGPPVFGVWGSAVYAARPIDPEVWARTVAAHEDAVRRAREAATVSVFVEEEGQEDELAF